MYVKADRQIHDGRVKKDIPVAAVFFSFMKSILLYYEYCIVEIMYPVNEYFNIIV